MSAGVAAQPAAWGAAIVVVAVLAGCAGADRTMKGWLGVPEPTPTPSTHGEAFYAALDGLPVRAEASSLAKVVGRLALHQKVYRTGVERGFAYVTAEKGGPTGWVDNAQLLWRLPAAREAAAAPSAGATALPPEAESTPPAVATATPLPMSTAVPTEPPPTGAPPPTATPRPAVPRTYDPF